MRSTETEEKSSQLTSVSGHGGKSSEAPLQNPENDSVYDFLYHDARRVASFISQFHRYGSLTAVKAIEEAESVGNTLSGATLSAGLPFVGQAAGNLSHNAQSREADKLEQTFDPLWRSARKFLDYLETENLLIREAESARIGQFVLITGRLAVFDMNIVQAAWKHKALKEAALNGMIAGLPVAPGNTAKQHKETLSAIFDFMRELPHVVQLGVNTEKSYFWGILNEQNMVTSSTDLLLKSGGSLSGTWTTVGILDAIPDSQEEAAGNTLMDLGAFGVFASTLAPSIRQLVGRPAEAYGVTPLLILREVSGA